MLNSKKLEDLLHHFGRKGCTTICKYFRWTTEAKNYVVSEELGGFRSCDRLTRLDFYITGGILCRDCNIRIAANCCR